MGTTLPGTRRERLTCLTLVEHYWSGRGGAFRHNWHLYDHYGTLIQAFPTYEQAEAHLCYLLTSIHNWMDAVEARGLG